MEKVGIVIDNMYLENCASIYQSWPVDIVKLPEILLRPGEEHYKTYIYDALPWVPKNGATNEQLEKLRKKKGYLDRLTYYDRIKVDLGYVRTKSHKCRSCGAVNEVPVQKLVDVKLSIGLLMLAWSSNVEKIILITGDADILPAVLQCESSKAIIRLCYVQEGNVKTSESLIRNCSEKQQLTKEDFQKLYRPDQSFSDST